MHAGARGTSILHHAIVAKNFAAASFIRQA
jgi:hypothetical protein